ncbi:MAG TPA: PAS domain-containing protein [Bryobacteraceae bacterium]|nr:PAS domain-containing protein [Bryobacteraceae bacterium]
MFDIRSLRAMLSIPDSPGAPGPSPEQEINRLRDRVAELEEENINLRQLEVTIQRNARLFDVILDRCHEGIGLLTSDLIVLRLIHSSIGYDEMDVSGQSFLPFIHPDDSGCFQKSFSQLLTAQAKSVSCEIRLRRKDESWVWLACEMTDMLDDPDVQAILLNVRPITTQKR